MSHRVIATALPMSLVLLLGLTSAAASAAGVSAQEPEVPTIVVESDEPTSPVSPYLTGTNNNEWFGNAQGLWEPERDAPDPDVLAKTSRSGINLVRYPGGTSANLFDWKRAIGPQEDRGCQTDGRNNPAGPLDSRYGPDEHMEFVDAAGADMVAMVASASESPEDAADWVEYMNAEVGTNPRGGTAWADVRAANGHPEAHDVGFWEIGNEIDRRAERYWLSQDNLTAIHQYAFGGTQEKVAERAARECDHRNSAAVGTGEADERLEVRYPPVVPDSQTVRVDGAAWTEVADLSTAGPGDKVYEFDAGSGGIRFGDGAHGAVLPDGGVVTVDYTSGPHPGFVDFYTEMKAADPDIDVCSTWAPVREASGLDVLSFPQLMAEAGRPGDYDCVTIHPYTNFKTLFGTEGWASAREGHDEYFLGEQAATELTDNLIAEVEEHNTSDAYVAVSEFGALWFGTKGIDLSSYPGWDTSMSHVTYMASQWTRFANRGLPFAIGNTLISEEGDGLRAVLGGEPGFVYTGDAAARELVKPFVDSGGQVVANRVDDNPRVSASASAAGATYDALSVTAGKGADGRLRIVVVNADPESAITANVVPAGFAHDRTVGVDVLAGETFTSFNSLEHPDDLTIEHATAAVDASAFRHTFAPASVTVLTLESR